MPTDASETREHELKFSPGALFQLPDLNAIGGVHVGGTEDIRLQAVYYDTHDLRLARSGASLRYRNAEGWTVKLPIARADDALTRDEIHVPGDPAEDPPDTAVDLVRALIRGEPLAAIARLNTSRTKVTLCGDDGASIGEVVDDEVSLLDGARLAARFREIEVELAASAPKEVVAALVARLRAAGSGSPDPVPKIVRALGPRAADPPDVPDPPELDDTSTAAEVVQAAIINGTRRLIAHDPGVRLGHDPEAVHQARVATRRLRSDLRTFRSILAEDWTEALRAELKWLGGLLGAVRDTEVLLERLEGRVAELPAVDVEDAKHLLDILAERRRTERDALLAAMRSDRYVALLDRLVAASRAPKFVDDVDDELDIDDDFDLDEYELDDDLASFVRPAWRKLRKAVDALGDNPSDAELHQVRIRAKRCRYAAEAVAPALGKRPKTFAKAIAEVQDELGEHQDAVVAGAWLREHRDGLAFVAGELAAVERAAARAARGRWPAVWERARRKKLRKWM
jgi:CHAD domain-containing protein